MNFARALKDLYEHRDDEFNARCFPRIAGHNYVVVINFPGQKQNDFDELLSIWISDCSDDPDTEPRVLAQYCEEFTDVLNNVIHSDDWMVEF